MFFWILPSSPLRRSIFFNFVFLEDAEVFFVMLAAVELAYLLFFAWFDFSVPSFLFREAMSPLSLPTLLW